MKLADLLENSVSPEELDKKYHLQHGDVILMEDEGNYFIVKSNEYTKLHIESLFADLMMTYMTHSQLIYPDRFEHVHKLSDQELGDLIHELRIKNTIPTHLLAMIRNLRSVGKNVSEVDELADHIKYEDLEIRNILRLLRDDFVETAFTLVKMVRPYLKNHPHFGVVEKSVQAEMKKLQK